MTSVRAATEQDADAIAHVHVQSWLTTYAGIVPEEYLASLDEAERSLLWREWLARDILVYVAEWNGEVVGFVSGGQIREPLERYDAELFAIYLHEGFQGRGIGTALLLKLAESLRTKGYTGLAVWVLASNPAISFYEKSGAVPVRSKAIEIGGALLQEAALGWSDLKSLVK